MDGSGPRGAGEWAKMPFPPCLSPEWDIRAMMLMVWVPAGQCQGLASNEALFRVGICQARSPLDLAVLKYQTFVSVSCLSANTSATYFFCSSTILGVKGEQGPPGKHRAKAQLQENLYRTKCTGKCLEDLLCSFVPFVGNPGCSRIGLGLAPKMTWDIQYRLKARLGL